MIRRLAPILLALAALSGCELPETVPTTMRRPPVVRNIAAEVAAARDRDDTLRLIGADRTAAEAETKLKAGDRLGALPQLQGALVHLIGYGGIGARLKFDADGPSIVDLSPGGPAAMAGLLPEDRILEIDGQAPDAAALGLRGLPDTQVALRFRRGRAEEEVRLTRAYFYRDPNELPADHAKRIEQYQDRLAEVAGQLTTLPDTPAMAAPLIQAARANSGAEAYRRALVAAPWSGEVLREAAEERSKAGDAAAAATLFRRYLVLMPEATDRPRIEFRLGELRAAAAERQRLAAWEGHWWEVDAPASATHPAMAQRGAGSFEIVRPDGTRAFGGRVVAPRRAEGEAELSVEDAAQWRGCSARLPRATAIAQLDDAERVLTVTYLGMPRLRGRGCHPAGPEHRVEQYQRRPTVRGDWY
ncbi:MAG: PDZ domain-containing protein [Alphaproteobacteria bacterium]|nr:PDZ domain-containing protein [Alphaproteobacteria bacterium]